MYGIYIHIPFCKSKCKYCDFASYPQKLHLQDEYVEALIEEIKSRKGTKADSVYIGGGTPSVLGYENTARLLCAIGDNMELAGNTEFTVEVNPATVDKAKAKLLIENGVNRISMGAQTFVDDELKRIGRIHQAEDVTATCELLRDTGFANISIDLMYALPGQSMESLAYSVDAAMKLKPEHISAYGLKIEEGTPFYTELSEGKINEADEDTFADMYEYIRDTLTASGYTHYEISNFSLPAMQSRHNLKYWQSKDYLGFGVAASSREGRHRFTHTRDIGEYLDKLSYTEDYHMTEDEYMREYVILALRLMEDGLSKEDFGKRFQREFDKVFTQELKTIMPYVHNTDKHIRLRGESVLVSNAVMCNFV